MSLGFESHSFNTNMVNSSFQMSATRSQVNNYGFNIYINGAYSKSKYLLYKRCDVYNRLCKKETLFLIAFWYNLDNTIFVHKKQQ